jgi:pimeloyl-ACP methyl ester carboxylesterase
VTELFVFAIFGVALVYLAVVLMLRHFQERIVFQPPADVPAGPVGARQVRYRASDGVELFAYVVGDCVPGSTVVLAFHGNAEVARWLVPWATTVARNTRSCVMLTEYRGYDGLGGSPTYESSSRDAQAALVYARTAFHVEPADMVYFGHSLGTAIAVELAAVEPPRSLALQAPFTSARDMTRRMIVPGLSTLWRFISRVHFNTLARVPMLSTPVWVAHGDRDFVIPVRMGHDVHDAAAVRGDLLIVHGAGHNDVPDVGGDAYWQWLARAIGAQHPATASPHARTERQSAP